MPRALSKCPILPHCSPWRISCDEQTGKPPWESEGSGEPPTAPGPAWVSPRVSLRPPLIGLRCTSALTV